MPGRIACVTATLCYAIGSILTRRALPMPPLTLTGGMLLLASALLVPLALAFEGLPDVTMSRATLALLFVGLLPTGLAFYLRVRIIQPSSCMGRKSAITQSAGMIFMSLVAYLVPFWAVLFGIAILGETAQPSLFAALTLILGGVAISQWQSLRQLIPR